MQLTKKYRFIYIEKGQGKHKKIYYYIKCKCFTYTVLSYFNHKRDIPQETHYCPTTRITPLSVFLSVRHTCSNPTDYEKCGLHTLITEGFSRGRFRDRGCFWGGCFFCIYYNLTDKRKKCYIQHKQHGPYYNLKVYIQ